MTNRSAAIRYARALFEVAVREGADLARVESELAEFDELFRTHATLGNVLLNPVVPAPKKRAALVSLTTSARTMPVVAKLLVLLAERDRLVILPDLLTSYRDRVLDHRNVVRAEIMTAVPVTPERERAIVHGLEQASGRTVSVTKRVVPELLGGLVAKVGSTVYDGSLTTQLQKMRQTLAESM